MGKIFRWKPELEGIDDFQPVGNWTQDFIENPVLYNCALHNCTYMGASMSDETINRLINITPDVMNRAKPHGALKWLIGSAKSLAEDRVLYLFLLHEVGFIQRLLPELDEAAMRSGHRDLFWSDVIGNARHVAPEDAIYMLLHFLPTHKINRIAARLRIAPDMRKTLVTLSQVSAILTSIDNVSELSRKQKAMIRTAIGRDNMSMARKIFDNTHLAMPNGYKSLFVKMRGRKKGGRIITGHDLKKAGIPEGPVYRRILDACETAQKVDQIKNNKKGRRKLLALAREVYNEYLEDITNDN